MYRMSDKLRILITNDDGYYSDGINAVFKELSRFAEVYLVAPDREQSASSHSLTLNRPLRMHKIDKHHYTTDGTPTDCVMLALHVVFNNKKPDFIVSGINHGANMGDDVTYSGTIAAAIEGAILNIPSIAASMANYEPGTPMTRAAKYIAKIIKQHDKLNWLHRASSISMSRVTTALRTSDLSSLARGCGSTRMSSSRRQIPEGCRITGSADGPNGE